MKVYELQGASISKKHIEIIIRQMFSRRKVKDPGDTTFSPGEVVENIELVEENRKMKDQGLTEAKAETIVLGITESSLNTQSWLAAASFQNTNRVLITNAVKGGEDRLRGLQGEESGRRDRQHAPRLRPGPRWDGESPVHFRARSDRGHARR